MGDHRGLRLKWWHCAVCLGVAAVLAAGMFGMSLAGPASAQRDDPTPEELWDAYPLDPEGQRQEEPAPPGTTGPTDEGSVTPSPTATAPAAQTPASADGGGLPTGVLIVAVLVAFAVGLTGGQLRRRRLAAARTPAAAEAAISLLPPVKPAREKLQRDVAELDLFGPDFFDRVQSDSRRSSNLFKFDAPAASAEAKPESIPSEAFDADAPEGDVSEPTPAHPDLFEFNAPEPSGSHVPRTHPSRPDLFEFDEPTLPPPRAKKTKPAEPEPAAADVSQPEPAPAEASQPEPAAAEPPEPEPSVPGFLEIAPLEPESAELELVEPPPDDAEPVELPEVEPMPLARSEREPSSRGFLEADVADPDPSELDLAPDAIEPAELEVPEAPAPRSAKPRARRSRSAGSGGGSRERRARRRAGTEPAKPETSATADETATETPTPASDAPETGAPARPPARRKSKSAPRKRPERAPEAAPEIVEPEATPAEIVEPEPEAAPEIVEPEAAPAEIVEPQPVAPETPEPEPVAPEHPEPEPAELERDEEYAGTHAEVAQLPGRRFERPAPWPEAAETWSCEIAWKPGYIKSYFRAMAAPPGSKRRRSIGESPPLRWTLMMDPEPPTPDMVDAVRELAEALESVGWARTDVAGPWYALRFLWRGEGQPEAVDMRGRTALKGTEVKDE